MLYDTVRLVARESKDAGQTWRLLALAAIYDGASRTEAAGAGGVTLQIVCDWVLKLNADGPEALVDYKGRGPQPILTDAHRAVLAQAIEDGPIPAIHGVVRWRVVDAGTLANAHIASGSICIGMNIGAWFSTASAPRRTCWRQFDKRRRLI